MMPGRTAPQCKNRYVRHLAPNANKSPWSEEDYALLKELRENGNKNWSEIASMMPGRTVQQCRYRYINYLASKVNKSQWTEEDDTLLKEFVKKNGQLWRDAAEFLPGKTGIDSRNRYYFLCGKCPTSIAQNLDYEWIEAFWEDLWKFEDEFAEAFSMQNLESSDEFAEVSSVQN
jgi:hypothetical protein